MKLFASLLFLVAFLVNAYCGPFGIEMGMNLDEVKKACSSEPIKSGEVYLITPIKSHPSFSQYAIRITPKYGVYFIKAISTISTSVYGTELKSEYVKLKNSLSKTYGKYEETDSLKNGSIWDEPRDWMMALVKNERYLFAYWEEDLGSDMPDDIKYIQIVAEAKSQESGMIILDYFLSNYDVVTKEIEKEQDSVF